LFRDRADVFGCIESGRRLREFIVLWVQTDLDHFCHIEIPLMTIEQDSENRTNRSARTEVWRALPLAGSAERWVETVISPDPWGVFRNRNESART